MISIVIPTLHERLEMLEEAIESAVNQTVPVEVIVSSPFPGRENKSNLAIKLNEMIGRSKGDAFVFLGDDDQLLPSFAEKLEGEMRRTGADIVGCGLQNFGADSGVHFPGVYPTAATLTKKDVWKKVGGYSEGMWPYFDGDFFFMAYDAGAKFVTIPDVLFKSRVHGGSVSSSLSKENCRPYYQKIRDKFGGRHPAGLDWNKFI